MSEKPVNVFPQMYLIVSSHLEIAIPKDSNAVVLQLFKMVRVNKDVDRCHTAESVPVNHWQSHSGESQVGTSS